MALPSSGQISISDVRTELLNTGKTTDYRLGFAGAPYALARDAGYVPANQSSTNKPNTNNTVSGAPKPISVWRGYDHSAQLTCPIYFETPNITGGNYVYYKVYISGTASTYTPITFSLVNADIYNYTARIYASYPFNNLGEITVSPLYNGSANSVYWHQMISNNDTLYFVFWNTDVA